MGNLKQRLLQYIEQLRNNQPFVFILVGLIISALTLVLFVGLASETIAERELDQLDGQVIALVRTSASPNMDVIMIWFSALGTSFIYMFCLPVLLVVLWKKNLWREAAVTAICLGGGVALNFLLKELFQRTRPEMFRVVDAAGYSFPSGHAMVSLCFYGMLGYLACLHMQGRRRRIEAAVTAVVIILAVGISRIYLGVHYPTDVAAGYLAGSTWLAFCIALLAWWELKVQRGGK